MTNKKKIKGSDLSRQAFNLVIFIIIWTVAICVSMWWNMHIQNAETSELAEIEARSVIFKDIIFRKWISMRGGVYAPVSEHTAPNPYLELMERDIVVPSGRKYTLINPAYMTRQVHELQKDEKGILGHITSLNPIRPENAPDEWETGALKSLQTGLSEVSSLQQVSNEPYMRLMLPLVTDTSCLKCHKKQGYREGDIRGGISVSVPMAPLLAVAYTHKISLAFWHAGIWMTGIAGLLLWGFMSRRWIKTRNQYENELLIKGTAVAASSNAVMITDMDGKITYANGMFFKMWKYSSGDIHDKNVLSLVKVDDPAEMLDQIKDMGSWFGELSAIHSDGSEFFVLLSAAVIKDENDSRLGITFSFSDISMRKAAEHNLRDSEEILRQRNDIMEKDLKIAQMVQKDMITRTIPKSGLVRIDFRYFPVEKIGGDYFNFFPHDEDGMGVFICDVSGHGIASALFHSLIKSSTEKLCKNFCMLPSDYLFNLNNELSGHMTSYFITAIYCNIIRPEGAKDTRLIFANGGHPSPVVVRKNGRVETFKASGTLIGVNENFTYEEKSIDLETGDRIFLYTDGVPETENERKEIIGYEDGLRGLFDVSGTPDLGGALDHVIEGLNSFRGQSPFKDDILIIGIEII
jgi:PAS domain S-box-containing protein